MAQEPRLIALDVVRGLCALAVTAGHLRLVMMSNYNDLPEPGLGQKAFFVATGLASQSVMVFFVLSGFLVGGSVLKAGPRFNARTYIIARLVRLWVVLLPALVWTLAVDTWATTAAPGMTQGEFFHRWTSGPKPGTYSVSPLTFLGNLAFVNTVFVESFGTNGPLWSLACEFWYYVLFPLLAVAGGIVGPRRSWMTRGVCLAAVVSILAVMHKSMAWGFLIWLMGAAAAAVHRAMPRTSLRGHCGQLIGGLLAFGLGLAASKLDHYGVQLPIPSRFLVGLGFAVLVVPLAKITTAPRWVRRPATALSEVSYTLYAVHFPPTLLLGALRYADRERTASSEDVFEFTVWLVLIVGLSMPFWWLFERNTPRLRRWVQKVTSPPAA
jgi:peptidoglycan/LPS O-acetylase OafA/YrhL